jgi:hypothetical protein
MESIEKEHKKKSKKSKKSKKKKSSKYGKSMDTMDKVKKISVDDYYFYAVEYREWLRKSKGVYFEDLSSLEAKEKFVGFIKRWNKGKLAIEYYNGKIREKDEGRRRTKFNWNIKSTHSSSLIK